MRIVSTGGGGKVSRSGTGIDDWRDLPGCGSRHHWRELLTDAVAS